MAKKQKLVELDQNEKVKVRRVGIGAIALTAIVCCILVGCFACRQDAGKNPGMTDAQKATMWKAKVLDVFWTPQTDATHDGVLKDLYLARDAKTALDAVTGNLMVYFLFNNDEVMKAASVNLTSESGTLTFSNDDLWTVKFSEKNEILFMTIKDSDGKEVFYQER